MAKKILTKIPAFTLLLIWFLFIVIPVSIIVLVAFKSPTDMGLGPLALPKELKWSNFIEVWNSSNLGRAFLNTTILTGCSTFGLIIFGASAAYPLARRNSRWSYVTYLYFIGGIIAPFGLAVVPLYRQMLTLGLINSLPGAMLIYISGSLPFVIFLYTGFIKSVPRELEEAATIDGCGPFRAFWRIIFPLLRPVTATVVITSGLWIWNDFFVPLLFLQKEEVRPVTYVIFSFTGKYVNDWTHIFATIVLSSLPVVLTFLFLQKYFIKGIASGAVKG